MINKAQALEMVDMPSVRSWPGGRVLIGFAESENGAVTVFCSIEQARRLGWSIAKIVKERSN
ncbi:MAG: hypothetical protein AAFX92_03840 [Pseudomonadota bacterium]